MVTKVPGDAPHRLTILGVTGSIGASAQAVVLAQRDRFVVEAVTAGTRVAELADAARRLGARHAAIADPAAYGALKEALSGTGIEAAAGSQAVIDAASRPADLVLAAIVGAAGLAPTMAALEAGRTVALANKECLVCAGALFMRTAAQAGTRVLPVDSEHNAIFQALEEDNRAAVERIILTASGGPFRQWDRAAMAAATPAAAMRHPNWSMGPKVTIDSATLMNKGLEVIEAHHLFGLASSEIDVLVHPQSAVHGIVVYTDGSMLAQMGAADMCIPIAHCLSWPGRSHMPAARLDLAALATLTFEPPDLARFPALALARQALDSGGTATNILNAANEIAVDAFLAGAIGYLDIVPLVERSLARAAALGLPAEPGSVEEALAVDAAGRRLAGEMMAGGGRVA